MVRIGTLPMRMLALKYGAHLVFSPEVVDRSLLTARRVQPQNGPFIEYRDNDKVLFRLHASERSRLIIQLGSSNAERAVQAARLVKQDCAGIDLNCGCPKKFSTHDGMGAALLETPDLLCDILRKLSVEVAPKPVSVKIRILPQGVEATKLLLMRIVETGIQALSIHGRTRHDTYEKTCDWEAVSELAAYVRGIRPDLFLNLSGDVFSLIDAQRAFEQVGVDGVLIARGAQWNVSVFSPNTRPLLDIIREYLELSKELQNHASNSKYAVVEMLVKDPKAHKELLRAIYSSKTIDQMLTALGQEEKTIGGRAVVERRSSVSSVDYEAEDVEFGYTKERQEARMSEKINKILSTP